MRWRASTAVVLENVTYQRPFGICQATRIGLLRHDSPMRFSVAIALGFLLGPFQPQPLTTGSAFNAKRAEVFQQCLSVYCDAGTVLESTTNLVCHGQRIGSHDAHQRCPMVFGDLWWPTLSRHGINIR
jgi:hypothetical protein